MQLCVLTCLAGPDPPVVIRVWKIEPDGVKERVRERQELEVDCSLIEAADEAALPSQHVPQGKVHLKKREPQ